MRSLLFLWLILSPLAWAEPLTVGGGQLLIDWRSKFTETEQQQIREWLTYTAESASLVTGRFPLAEVNVIIQKATSGKGPVPWANTIRHTWPQGVSFHVQPKYGLKAMKEDWTATHEFSHLLLPYPGRDDIWISEGFASYYQNLLMMRKGTLPQAIGWQKLVDGLRRGEADRNQSLSLAETSKRMRELGAYKRVYWSGALYFLEADLKLRSLGSSLDAVVTEFQSCCRKSRHWTGWRLAQALDQAAASLTGTPQSLFSTQFKRYQTSVGLPDYSIFTTALGIDVSNKTVQLDETEPFKQLRDTLASPR